MLEILWLIQLISSALMTGVIWLIQMVHYPAFRYIDSDRTKEFHGFHTKYITPVVAPTMIVELIVGLGLIHYAGIAGWIITGFNLILWLSTFLLQVPLHQQLFNDWDQKEIRQLVYTNWIRTITWTLKTLVVGCFVYSIL